LIYKDQTGFEVEIKVSPKRIVSLVPSQTELLAYLGLNRRVAGITRYCVHPTQWKETKVVVGGTKIFDLSVIDQLNPDLIIGNKEENTHESILSLREKFPVWISDVNNLSEALTMIRQVGRITDEEDKAYLLADAIVEQFDDIRPCKGQTVLYLIWRKPWMAAASGTFIGAMLEEMSLTNVVANLTRYPELSDEEIRSLNPDFVMLSSEPFPFREIHVSEIRQLLPHTKILTVNGELFSWYGSRLLEAPAYFNSLPIVRA
jgi:ABC-type Fe3+-hydroxamate transport system substrate-binding protein